MEALTVGHVAGRCVAQPVQVMKTPFEVDVAVSPEARLRAWGLVHERYLAMGYAQPGKDGLWYGVHDALPSTTTFTASEGRGREIAAVTAIDDSPLGLPADGLYAQELNGLRATGRHATELTALACRPMVASLGRIAVMELLRAALVVGRDLDGTTDFLMTVNPRHVRFYRDDLLFAVIGGERTYGKVGGAPAVLLRLDLDTAVERYRGRYGDGGLHHFFFGDQVAGQTIRDHLGPLRRTLPLTMIEEYFIRRRPLLSTLDEAQRRHVLDCHRGLTGADDPSRADPPRVA